MPRVGGFGNGTPRRDEHSNHLERCHKKLLEGLVNAQASVAQVKRWIDEIDRLTAPVVHPEGVLFRRAGYGEKYPAGRWVARFAHRADHLCKNCYSARHYEQRKADSEVTV
jgi:hypothetical protein